MSGYSNDDLTKFYNLVKFNVLNAVEEVELAKELLKIHKWSGMAKFVNLVVKHVWLL